MTNIPLIVHLGDGCVVVGTLVSFQQNLPAPAFFNCAIHQLPLSKIYSNLLNVSLS